MLINSLINYLYLKVVKEMKAVETEAAYDFLNSESEFFELKTCIEDNNDILGNLITTKQSYIL